MLGYLKGQILENQDGRLLLLVSGGEIGYSVCIPQSAEYDLLHTGKSLELFIHTHVREDALDLFGFASRAEKELFMTLLSVNGIGPKVAMGILSKANPSQFIQAILEGDKSFLTQIPGVGKKTAERFVLELADKLKKKMESGAFGSIKSVPSSSGSRLMGSGAVSALSAERSVFRDAKDALVGLGYREQEITVLLNRVLEEGLQPTKAEDLIKTALQRLG